MHYGNQEKGKQGQQQQKPQKSQKQDQQFDAQQPTETGFSKERPYTQSEHKELDRPTSAIDAQMDNSTQKDVNDDDPITGVDKSLGADTQWGGQKQDPKPGPAQPQVGQNPQQQQNQNQNQSQNQNQAQNQNPKGTNGRTGVAGKI